MYPHFDMRVNDIKVGNIVEGRYCKKKSLKF